MENNDSYGKNMKNTWVNRYGSSLFSFFSIGYHWNIEQHITLKLTIVDPSAKGGTPIWNVATRTPVTISETSCVYLYIICIIRIHILVWWCCVVYSYPWFRIFNESGSHPQIPRSVPWCFRAFRSSRQRSTVKPKDTAKCSWCFCQIPPSWGLEKEDCLMTIWSICWLIYWIQLNTILINILIVIYCWL